MYCTFQGSKMPLPQISFTKRSQVLVWVSDPMSKARIRGIMVMISSYLDNITTEEALEIYEPGINIGLNQETPNTLRTKTDENEPGTISVSVAQVQEEGSSDSNKFPLAFIAKLGQRSAGRSPATYIPPHEYLARGWDANNNQWRSVLWPALDKHFRAAALERTSPVWNIQCPWKQAQKTIGATTALPCWRSSNIPGRNETCI
ncbi:hypothetical protein DFH06DRAFT_284889 [Mycena polygramma]|nr:hypothetical protein DFH06DRAFT_284889 [Mycena polygramma]